MKAIIRSEKTIKTETDGNLVIIETDPDSLSSLQLLNLRDLKIIDLKVEDEKKSEVQISFWDEEDNGHVFRNIYTLKKDADDRISLFDGMKNLVNSSNGEITGLMKKALTNKN